MKKRWIGMLALVAALGLAGTGCSDDGDGDGHSDPAVDVNGKWEVWMDGDPLGVMTLEVSQGGVLKGWLDTTQDATGKLSGAMDGYVAEFTVTFANGVYLATLTFSQDASGASGTLMDSKGFQGALRMTARFDD